MSINLETSDVLVGLPGRDILAELRSREDRLEPADEARTDDHLELVVHGCADYYIGRGASLADQRAET
jgi:hypothetical protein